MKVLLVRFCVFPLVSSPVLYTPLSLFLPRSLPLFFFLDPLSFSLSLSLSLFTFPLPFARSLSLSLSLSLCLSLPRLSLLSHTLLVTDSLQRLLLQGGDGGAAAVSVDSLPAHLLRVSTPPKQQRRGTRPSLWKGPGYFDFGPPQNLSSFLTNFSLSLCSRKYFTSQFIYPHPVGGWGVVMALSISYNK